MAKFYRIRVQGHLDNQWREWLEWLEINHLTNGDTLLSGWLSDQAALHGVLDKLYELGLPLIGLEVADAPPAPGLPA